ncbi:uncharacterized protein CANTADRAFT_53858 [Suhomyces tanzawaensis NRRL Y-17324]|uniref:Jacalin-type lectin domain-containing protein n=1 Tax=Suhomyces tanzawaensis NRRL Y-17324 TaxID=984487 RepID=A0A1E4SG30_9ASCO|nr:uncharacterized protein CANTADRAFT_53858 [Suhomyces tanzawaensis NRRL Y-17324]ODV78436.1 hypothetical protein CANTADRAFT_53858 [Suhomyces tanzawaensis NRRL Y-17324]
MTITFNYQNNEIVSSPTVIVSGSTSAIGQGLVTFTNNDNKVFPPQTFEVNQGHFKAILHVSPGDPNVFNVVVSDGYLNGYGFAEARSREVDTGSLSLVFYPLPQNKPIHLCVILGRDSNGSYDMPKYRLNRGEKADLQSAILKLKVAGRLMQAYTQEEMRSIGLSNRSFQFVEEEQDYQGLFGFDVKSPTPHTEIKVHVLRSPKTVAELRDPNIAQQNPNASDAGGLFSHALDLIKNNPEIYDKRRKHNTAVQCAVLYLDATYDRRNDMILTHAALGGGDGDVKLAIFGSHGLHSWPINFPQVTPSFLDATHLSKNEVANDANECGTSWECLNITLGAFMHEIGHLLGCPHQVDGVMLRDYVWFNRSYMTRELQCLRTNSPGAVIGRNGVWPVSCHWNRLDLIRFLYHDSFSLPIDTFPKVYSTTYKDDNSYENNTAPTSYNTPKGGAVAKSSAGIYLVEFIIEDLARHHMVFYPENYGGKGPQHELNLNYNTCYEELKKYGDKASPDFDVKILSIGGEITIWNFKNCSSGSKDNIIRSDFGLGKGTINAYKSALLGSSKDQQPQIIGFDIRNIYKVRVYHGGALDGVRFFYTEGKAQGDSNNVPPVPPRDYSNKFSKMFKKLLIEPSVQGGSRESLIGNEKSHYSDYEIRPGQYITKFHFRNGAWLDAIQFETNTGEKSPMFGNAEGGHLSTLEAPGPEYTIVGMYGYTGSWMDGLGIVYTDEIR